MNSREEEIINKLNHIATMAIVVLLTWVGFNIVRMFV
jgi:hypothetical protein